MPQPSLFFSLGDGAYSIYDRIQLIQASNEYLKVMEKNKNFINQSLSEKDERESSFQACSALIELHMKHVVQEEDGLGRVLVNIAFQNLLTVEENYFQSNIEKNTLYDRMFKPHLPASHVHALVLNVARSLMYHQNEKLKVELESARLRLLNSPIVMKTTPYLSLEL